MNYQYKKENIKVYCTHCGADQQIPVFLREGQTNVLGASQCWHCKKIFTWFKKWKFRYE